SQEESRFLEAALAVRDWLGTDVRQLSEPEVAVRFPSLNLPAGMQFLYEETAGHFSPRQYVRAATDHCERAGVTVIRRAATRLSATGDGVRITLSDGT